MRAPLGGTSYWHGAGHDGGGTAAKAGRPLNKAGWLAAEGTPTTPSPWDSETASSALSDAELCDADDEVLASLT